MGPRACLDGCGKSRLHRDSIPGPSSRERVGIPTELSRPMNYDLKIPKFQNINGELQLAGYGQTVFRNVCVRVHTESSIRRHK